MEITESSFQLTVESNYVIAIATLSDWVKRLASVFQPMRSKTKTNRTMYAWFFPRYERVTGTAVFKWLSKVITWLRFLRLVIGLKDSRQFINQWEAKSKPIAPCTRDISRASGELQVIDRNCVWFMTLFAPVVSNCFGFGFSTVIWKPLYSSQSLLLSLRLAGSSTHKSVWNVNLSGLRTKLQNNLDPPSTTTSPQTYTRSEETEWSRLLHLCCWKFGHPNLFYS